MGKKMEWRKKKRLKDLMEEEQALEEGYYNAEKGLERFYATLEMRMRIQDEMRRFYAGEVRLTDYADEGCDDGFCKEKENILEDTAAKKEKAEDKKIVCVRKVLFPRYKGAIAAALVLALFVGGTFGAYAEKRGFFQWVKKGEDGVSMMTSPEGMDGNYTVSERYYEIDEIPEEYQKFVWEPEQIPNNMEFVHCELLKYKKWNRLLCLYESKEQKERVEFVCKVFENALEYHSQKYDTYSYMYKKEYNGMTLEFFKKDSEDGTEYAVGFFYGNVQYIVQGNLNLEDIAILANDYCEKIVR